MGGCAMVRRRGSKVAAWAVATALTCGALGLSGCFGPSAEQIIRDGLTEDLTELATDGSDARAVMAEGLSGTGELAEFGVDAEAFLDELLEGCAFDITAVEVSEEGDEGSATAHVTLTCKSLAEATPRLETRMAKLMEDDSGKTQEEIYAELGSALVKAVNDIEPQEHELELGCTKTGENTWELDDEAVASITAALLG